MLAVMAAAVTGYMKCGWAFGDAAYLTVLTVLTVFTVGYHEVHPVVGRELCTVTIGRIVLGCSAPSSSETCC